MSVNSKKLLISQISQEKIMVSKVILRSRKMICPICETETEMLSLDSAVSISGISTRQILDESKNNFIHTIETKSGHIWVCRKTLGDFYQ
jgi:hypothetical protein